MSAYRASPSRPDRAKAIVAVAAVYLVLGGAYLLAPRDHLARQEEERTQMIDIALPKPPPPDVPEPERGKPRQEEGEAGKKAEPTPVVAPKPAVVLPVTPPVPAAPVAGTGSATSAGAALAGTGPGAGGQGTGRGGGGSGGGGRAAQWISGGLRDSDYPRDALAGNVSGMVSVRFTVLPTGRVDDCRIARSSGSPALDRATCSLLTQRLRFRPATDANGRPVSSELGSDYTWGIRRRF